MVASLKKTLIRPSFFCGAIKTLHRGYFGTLVCYITGGEPGDKVFEEVKEFAEFIARRETMLAG